jgi:hypothetical protein
MPPQDATEGRAAVSINETEYHNSGGINRMEPESATGGRGRRRGREKAVFEDKEKAVFEDSLRRQSSGTAGRRLHLDTAAGAAAAVSAALGGPSPKRASSDSVTGRALGEGEEEEEEEEARPAAAVGAGAGAQGGKTGGRARSDQAARTTAKSARTGRAQP